MKQYIIPIFIPHFGCPNMCVFCNQQKITGLETPVEPQDIEEIISRHLAGITRPYHIEAAFYGGSFTALSLTMQNRLLEPAVSFLRQGKIHSIRLSTRPDAVNQEILRNLANKGVGVIELGVQSLDDTVLMAAGRGHTVADVAEAVAAIRCWPMKLGLQLMPGLPGDTRATILATLAQTIRLKPDMVRLYPTVILENTKLAELYREKLYTPLTLEEAVEITAVMKLELERNQIAVIRTGLQSAENLRFDRALLAGPYHPAFGEMVESHIFWLGLTQALPDCNYAGEVLYIFHAAADTSKLRGNKNTNTQQLLEKYAFQSVFYQVEDRPRGSVRLRIGSREHTFSRGDILLKSGI